MSINLGQKIIDAIENRRDRKRKSQAGSIGDFWRNGGNDLLYSDLPVTTGGLIIDAGAYRGEWSSGMIARYGCQAILFEPVPNFFQQLQAYYKHNSLVKIHNSAVGGKDRQSLFSLLDNGTSEYRDGKTVEFSVVDIDKVFKQNIGNQRVACMKLNIEGGEYEVLERMLEAKLVTSCDSFLIQFHRYPQGYEKRYEFIVSELEKTHVRK